MIKPIDIQVVIKNIDHVAKINKVHEQTLAGQQANAKDEMVKNVRHNMESVSQSNHSEKNSVNTDEKGNSEYSEDEKNKNSDKDEEKQHHKSNEPNKGKIIDIEG